MTKGFPVLAAEGTVPVAKGMLNEQIDILSGSLLSSCHGITHPFLLHHGPLSFACPIFQ